MIVTPCQLQPYLEPLGVGPTPFDIYGRPFTFEDMHVCFHEVTSSTEGIFQLGTSSPSGQVSPQPQESYPVWPYRDLYRTEET